jgi:ribosomal protein S12 methylthiotransferase
VNYKIISLGCPKNLVDSEHIAARLEGEGHILSDDADLVVINTCAFIADAAQESIETILEEAQAAVGNGKKLMVTGCLVERYGEKLQELLPEVELFVARDRYHAIEALIGEKGHFGRETEGRADEGHMPRKVLTPPPSTYLKIQEGCNNRCSYCTIPSIRGGLKSRLPGSVRDELSRLMSEGFREFNLIGQDITSYGLDIQSNLTELLESLLSVPGDYCIRLLYMHPRGINDRLLELIAREERIIKYLDIPIQHSEDAILGLMKRRYSKQDLNSLFRNIRERMPDAVLRTTVMVGFPQESEEDFENLCAFVSEWQFDNLGAFIYSKEEGTAAARIKGHLRKGIKKQRYQKIMELQKEISRKRLKRMVGRTMEVIVEAIEDGRATGRLLLQAPDVDGIAFIKGDCRAGEIRQGVVTGTLDYDVIIELS